MTRKSKRQLEREVEKLVDAVPETEAPAGKYKLSDADRHDAYELILYMQQVASGENGVNLDDRKILTEIQKAAQAKGTAGELTVADYEAAAAEIGFIPGV